MKACAYMCTNLDSGANSMASSCVIGVQLRELKRRRRWRRRLDVDSKRGYCPLSTQVDWAVMDHRS